MKSRLVGICMTIVSLATNALNIGATEITLGGAQQTQRQKSMLTSLPIIR